MARRSGFVLTPPTMVVFIISVVLAVIALIAFYGRVSIPVITPGHVFDLLAVAYLVLVAGVLFRQI